MTQEEEQKHEEVRRQLDDLVARAIETGIMLAVGYLAGCKDKPDAWGKKLGQEDHQVRVPAHVRPEDEPGQRRDRQAGEDARHRQAGEPVMTPRSWEDMKKDPAVKAVTFGLLVASLGKKPYDLEFILRMADAYKQHVLAAAQEARP